MSVRRGGNGVVAKLGVPDDALYPPNRPWRKYSPPAGGIINIKGDDYITAALHKCLAGDQRIERNFIWHYIWEHCPYLPSWRLATFDADVDPGWNSPTEFINWFTWNVATAFIWMNHQLEDLGPADDIMSLLTSRKSLPMSEMMFQKAGTLRRNNKLLGRMVARELNGPGYWQRITAEPVSYPTWGLQTVIYTINNEIDPHTAKWAYLTKTRADRGALRRVHHIVERLIPDILQHIAIIYNSIGRRV